MIRRACVGRGVEQWQQDQHSDGNDGKSSAGIGDPFADTKTQRRDPCQPSDEGGGSSHDQPFAGGHPRRVRSQRKSKIGDQNKSVLRHQEDNVEPQIPRH